MTHYSDIIVGAGSSGAVLAARLSEDPDRRVLLVEAGPDTPPDRPLPPDIRRGTYPSFEHHDWGFQAETLPGRPASLLPRGRVVGGSSAVNTSLAARPDPRDFQEWAAAGLPEWAWDEVLPHFRSVERDLDYPDSPVHGASGPIPVHRYRTEALLPLQFAMLEICQKFGFPVTADHNEPGATGVGVMPVNTVDGVRISAAIGYLAPARARTNLQIRTGVLVDRVLHDGDRATGIRLATPDGPEDITGDRVVLSAGAIGTPAILLRSGIGPAGELRALGIPVVADLPGVGRNLWDHPSSGVVLAPRSGTTDAANPVVQVVLHFTAPGSADDNDMHMYAYNQVNSDAPEHKKAAGDGTVQMFAAGLLRPRSTGRITLTSTDPAVQPRIELNFLADEEDRRRLRESVRLAWRMAHEDPMRDLINGVIEPDERTVSSDAELDAYLDRTVTTHHHVAGTARMGGADDPQTVVDGRGRVRGVPSLLVADASVIPVPLRANTNLTCMAIGERIAGWLRAA